MRQGMSCCFRIDFKGYNQDFKITGFAYGTINRYQTQRSALWGCPFMAIRLTLTAVGRKKNRFKLAPSLDKTHEMKKSKPLQDRSQGCIEIEIFRHRLPYPPGSIPE
jgi:hypothetical protein